MNSIHVAGAVSLYCYVSSFSGSLLLNIGVVFIVTQLCTWHLHFVGLGLKGEVYIVILELFFFMFQLQ